MFAGGKDIYADKKVPPKAEAPKKEDKKDEGLYKVEKKKETPK